LAGGLPCTVWTLLHPSAFWKNEVAYLKTKKMLEPLRQQKMLLKVRVPEKTSSYSNIIWSSDKKNYIYLRKVPKLKFIKTDDTYLTT